MSESDPSRSVGPDLFRLEGAVALVTGAAGAFGRVTALGLARAGASLFLTDLDAPRLAETVALVRSEGGRCESLAGDSSEPATIEMAFQRLDSAWGRIDVLVNNAGINPQQGLPESFPIEVWERVLHTNLTSYFLHAQAAARRMIAAGRGGSIINVSSIAGASALGRGNLAFGVSKAGVDQLTRELAVEWAVHGIRVNSIQPCQFLNDGLRALIADPLRAATVERMIGGIPMGRMGQPEEIVGPILFLACPAAAMVTGVNLPVDGGNLALNPGGSLPRRSERAVQPATTTGPGGVGSPGASSKPPYLVLRADDVEPFTHPDETSYHSQHILGRETTGGHDLLLNRGVVDARHGLGGTNHPRNDEVYYALSGWAYVDLGGHPDRGDGAKTYRLDDGMVAFIPAGVFHRLRNVSDEPFSLLTIWPQPAARGANGIHDLRLDTWGTGFRLREGCRLVQDAESARVVAPSTGWDPLEPARATSGA
jgi:gluconate 5-dehydrogenase